jgi:hypothetical protein
VQHQGAPHSTAPCHWIQHPGLCLAVQQQAQGQLPQLRSTVAAAQASCQVRLVAWGLVVEGCLKPPLQQEVPEPQPPAAPMQAHRWAAQHLEPEQPLKRCPSLGLAALDSLMAALSLLAALPLLAVLQPLAVPLSPWVLLVSCYCSLHWEPAWCGVGAL